MTDWLKKYSRLAVVLLLAAAAGCSGGGGDEEPAAVDRMSGMSPDKVVQKLFSEFQFANYDEAGMYFSESLSDETVVGFLDWLQENRTVGRFWTAVTKEGTEEAVVMVKYNYNPKNNRGLITSQKEVDEIEIHLARENDVWKIRTLGIEAFDEHAERDVFLNCLNAVMDATIAQEKIRKERDAYSDSRAALMTAHPIDEFACREITIREAGEEDFLISAVTENLEPCEIIANTDEFQPATYEECASSLYLPSREEGEGESAAEGESVQEETSAEETTEE